MGGSKGIFTCLLFASALIALVAHHFVDLLRHGLDVQRNQLVEITVRVLATNLEDPSNGELVLLRQLQHIDMLIHIVVNFPRDGKMVGPIGGGANNAVTTAMRLKELLGLAGVEGPENGVLDDSLGAPGAGVDDFLELLLIPRFLLLVPFVNVVVHGSSVWDTQLALSQRQLCG